MDGIVFARPVVTTTCDANNEPRILLMSRHTTWIIAVCMMPFLGCTAELSEGDQDGTGETTQAFTANWDYSWGTTSDSFVNIGTSINRTCFMTGLVGNLANTNPDYWMYATGAGVSIGSNGDYNINVYSQGGAVGVFVRCVNSSAGRTDEFTWQTGAAKKMMPVTDNRRCFLTSVMTSNTVPNQSHGFNFDSDNVQVWHDDFNWWIGGVQSGAVFATARCIDVSGDYGSWEWVAGDPGTRKDPLAYNPGGVTCMLTGVGGHFNQNDWLDGAYISYDAGINQFYMNTKNGHSGWATCIQ